MNTRIQYTGRAVALMLALIVLFQNCNDSKSGMSGNGSGYTGHRPEPGIYTTKLLSCANAGRPLFETLTVAAGSDTVLIESECLQTSREVPVSDLGAESYRKDHLTHDNRIYERGLPRAAEYFNEALCDFPGEGFGLLIRWYDVYSFHVAHIFSRSAEPATVPVLRYSDHDFGNGNFGTGYLGTDFELAVLSSFRIGERGLAGVFNGKVAGATIEAFGYCVSTEYTCSPEPLVVTASGESGRFAIQSASGGAIDGDVRFTGELGELRLAVQVAGELYDCGGYVSKINNELSVGGCVNRPTGGGTPRPVMLQVRGQIQWSSDAAGTVDASLCVGNSLLEVP